MSATSPPPFPHLRNASHLIALAPPPILPLVTKEEVARLARIRARLIRLADEGKALGGEHGRVGEADAPGADPATLGRLRVMDVLDGVPDGAAGEGVLGYVG